MCCQILASLWNLFHPPAFSINLPTFLSPPPPGNPPIFFTGSFNPWHEGHSRCVELTRIKNLIIAPDNNPWKENQPGTSSPFKTLQGIPKNLFHDNLCSLFTGFLGKQGPNPTVSWIIRLKTPKPGLIMGDDNFMNLEDWSKSKLFLKSISKLIVIPRLANDEDFKKQKAKLMKINPSLVIERREHHDCEHIASTKLKT